MDAFRNTIENETTNKAQFTLEFGTDKIDWPALCEVFRRAPLGTREPDKLASAAKNSYVVCSAFIDDTIVGFGRAISDGQYQSAIYDVVVLPDICLISS